MNIDIVLNTTANIYVKDIPNLLASAVHELDIRNNFSDLVNIEYLKDLDKFKESINLSIKNGSLVQRSPTTLAPVLNSVGSTANNVVTVNDFTDYASTIGFNVVVKRKFAPVSQAPAPISPVRGSPYVSPKDTDRKPRWQKWKLIPEVKLWEAVSLSLNIEPEKINMNGNAWMGSHHPFTEGDTFNDRLEVLKQHKSNPIHFPTPCALSITQWYTNQLRLDEFAAWCIHIGFDIPDELRALAQNMIVGSQNKVITSNHINSTAIIEKSVKIEVISDWKAKARQLAEEFYNNDSKMNCRRTLKGYADLVMDRMQELQIHGPRGRIDNVNTIIREALAADKWWGGKSK